MYLNGQGVPQDYAEALKWLRLAANQGFAEAQDGLGRMYEHGQGVPKDDAEAAKWIRLAANQGDAGAQVGLGGMYVAGRGVPKDYVLSYMWFNLAAAHGDELAAFAADLRDGVPAHFMSPEQIAEAQRLAHGWKPTTQPTKPQ
jgi:TPR repeat protein